MQGLYRYYGYYILPLAKFLPDRAVGYCILSKNYIFNRVVFVCRNYKSFTVRYDDTIIKFTKNFSSYATATGGINHGIII